MLEERIIVCPDAHHPFVDERAWACFLEAAYVARANRVVIIGDFGDYYAVSSHDKSPERKETFADELADTNAALDQLQGLGIPVDYCEGNHEQRLDRYLAKVAPELYGVALGSKELLRISERGWSWYPYKTICKHGHVRFTHDVGRSGKNAARQSLVDFGDNLVFGHTHRLGVAYEGTIDGGTRVCLNVGWLGDFEAIDYRHKFMAKRDWQHGFGLVDIDDRGNGYCQAIPIINGRAMIDGKVAKA